MSYHPPCFLSDRIRIRNECTVLNGSDIKLSEGLPGVSPDELWPPAPQGEEDESVEDVAEGVWVEEVL